MAVASPTVELSVSLRRLGYRTAYLGLRLYWIVLHPTSHGVKCVLTDGDQILLVRHTYGPGVWDLPGGSMKRGESPAETARREMTEELGVTVDDWTPLEELMVDALHRHDRVHFLRAEVRAPEITIDRAELGAARWFSRRSLPDELGRYARAIIATLAPGE